MSELDGSKMGGECRWKQLMTLHALSRKMGRGQVPPMVFTGLGGGRYMRAKAGSDASRVELYGGSNRGTEALEARLGRRGEKQEVEHLGRSITPSSNAHLESCWDCGECSPVPNRGWVRPRGFAQENPIGSSQGCDCFAQPARSLATWF